MTVATNANVTKLYIATFDRAPDAGGLDYWVNNSGLTLEQIAQSFFDQPETQSKYAGVDNRAFVETIYRNVLGREGEAAGVDYWLGELNAGNISRDTAILAVIGGAQGTDATLLEHKTEVGIYFATHGDGNPDAFAVIDEVKLDPSSVDLCKQWIDGKLPAGATPSTYFVLDDDDVAYDLTGSAKDDVFVIEDFKTATIHGQEGSDTLDFQDFKPGVSVNLSTGLGPVGDAGTAMKFDWIENVRGTSGNDTLTGNSDANILIAMGGTDVIDGGVGNDRIMFLNIEDVAKSTINGGQNTDTLEITEQTAISMNDASVANVSDVEILQVGYEEEGVPAATTITVTGGTPLSKFKEIRGTESFDRKGNAASDVIQSGANLDVSTVKLTSIEELKATAANTKIVVGKDTLTSVQKVTGETGATTDLELSAKTGDVFDMTVPTFSNIDRVAQTSAVASTIVVNQSLINSLASSDGKDGFGVKPTDAAGSGAPTVANFGLSTLKASGIGLDLSALNDGDANFKAIEFGTAKEVTVSNINDTIADTDTLIATDGTPDDGLFDLSNLRSITGSVNDSDLLRIKPSVVSEQDLTYLDGTTRKGIAITAVERLDFEEVSNVALMNANLTDVRQISGDDDQLNGATTTIDAGYETATGGLNLKGKTLQDIYGLGNGVSGAAGTVTIDSKTTWDSAFKSLDTASKQTIILAESGSYDFSNISVAQNSTVVVNNVDITNDAQGDGAQDSNQMTITHNDLIKGSKGADVVLGGKVGFGYSLGAGDDSFLGQDTANEVVEGGDGNDLIALGDNSENDVVTTFATAFATAFAGPDLGNVQGGSIGGIATGDFVRDGLSSSGKGAVANGGAGDDTITSGKGDDVLFGGEGHDYISGGADNDILVGENGDDILSGGDGADIIVGGDGNDVLEGNDGEDYLYGGKGVDSLRGGTLEADGTINYGAQDHFHFAGGETGTTDATVDKLVDFLSYSRAKAEVALADTDKSGTVSDTEAANFHDVIYLDWYLDDAAPEVAGLNALDISAASTFAAASGDSYDTLFGNYDDRFASETTLLAAAEKALDQLYDDRDVAATLAAAGADYTSLAVQFEYGGKEYLAINAYADNAGSAGNNFNTSNDLLIEMSGVKENWALNADTDGAIEVVVTRWDTASA